MRVTFPKLIACASLAALAGCDDSTGTSAEPSNTAVQSDSLGDAAERAVENIQIRTIAGGRKQNAELLPTKAEVDLAQIAEAVRNSDLTCDQATEARQLRQNGKTMEVYKIDCTGGRSYQITMMDGQTFYKPWTGVILGN